MFSVLDWTIITLYICGTFAAGAWMSRTASRGMSSYFVADRSLPWWWLGTSMVATTFAADTPLAVTGIVARDGIAGNWFIWTSIFTYITITVFFAGRWRSSLVLTDVELAELRYGGQPARILRIFKAGYFSLLVNGIVLGWVFRAMSKISSPFINWQQILGPDSYQVLTTNWPDLLIFDNLNNTLTVLVIFSVVVAYSTMGGIRGVILTDLFQFALAMVCAILFACFAVAHVGGLESMVASLHSLYPDRADKLLSFWPGSSDPLLPINIFLIYVGLLWWAQYFSDGSGYLAQRINTARNPADAEKGSLWFTFACIVLRSWPWIIVALAALIVFPLHDPTYFSPLGAGVAADREMGYPLMMKLVLPSGLLGLTFVSLLAAFMSTVDTHLNWSTSYLINDIYKRFIRPGASQRHLVRASRICVILIAALSVVIAGQITSIEKAWKFFVAIGAGVGLPQMLRWLWWRVNAWTEITGMAVAFIIAVALYLLMPDMRTEHVLGIVVLTSTAASLAATLLTRPVDRTTLEHFACRVQPLGLWGALHAATNTSAEMKSRCIAWLLGVSGMFLALFGLGSLLLGTPGIGAAQLCAACMCLWLMLRRMYPAR
jgi:solute:Na+ symporter, SSS family